LISVNREVLLVVRCFVGVDFVGVVPVTSFGCVLAVGFEKVFLACCFFVELFPRVLKGGRLLRRDLKLLRKLLGVLDSARCWLVVEAGRPAGAEVAADGGLRDGLVVFLPRKLNRPKREGRPAGVGAGPGLLPGRLPRVEFRWTMVIPVGRGLIVPVLFFEDFIWLKNGCNLWLIAFRT
jgi:hypothetical protein